MSDAEDYAARDRRRTSGAAPDHPSAADLPSTLGAAPWERFFEPPPDDSLHRWQPEPVVEPVEPHADDTEQVGSHTAGGVSVADLIAKIGAPTAARASHRRAAPEIEPPVEPSGPQRDLPVELQETQVIDDLAYSLELFSELPD